jgi:hypothetical protein
MTSAPVQTPTASERGASGASGVVRQVSVAGSYAWPCKSILGCEQKDRLLPGPDHVPVRPCNRSGSLEVSVDVAAQDESGSLSSRQRRDGTPDVHGGRAVEAGIL